MITQKAISVRMDCDTLEQLDQEAFVSGVKRNRLINCAARDYVRASDLEKGWRFFRQSGKSLGEFLSMMRGKYPHCIYNILNEIATEYEREVFAKQLRKEGQR